MEKFNPFKKTRHASLRIGRMVRQSCIEDEANTTTTSTVMDSSSCNQNIQAELPTNPRPRFLSVDDARYASLVHQRSSESHDSTTSGYSYLSTSSGISSSSGGGGGGGGGDVNVVNSKRTCHCSFKTTKSKLKMEYASARDFDERSSTGGSTSGCGAKGDAFSHFEEEDNFKGIWRRAFHTLKIKDKEKDKNLKKNLIKKRDSKSNMNQEKTTHSSKEMDDVDPVYSLLKSAAGKGPKSGSCSCLNSDFSVADSAYAESSNTSSPTSGMRIFCGNSSTVKCTSTIVPVYTSSFTCSNCGQPRFCPSPKFIAPSASLNVTPISFSKSTRPPASPRSTSLRDASYEKNCTNARKGSAKF